MRQILILLITINLFCMPIYALELDTSIDDEIRKKYNPSKLEQDVSLPDLPKNINDEYSEEFPLRNIPSSTPATTFHAKQNYTYPKKITNDEIIKKIASGSYATIKEGTKIRLKLLTGISDKTKRGTKIVFASRYPVTTTYYTIPSGTIFQGEVADVHRPQLTGNGSLIKININSVILNDSIQPINAEVTEVNYKNVYFNNIKGKRKYLKSIPRTLKPGGRFFYKMLTTTRSLATSGSSIILTPFSLFFGVGALGANIIASPALALFYKGDRLYLKEGSEFEVKLLQDVFIYK